MKKEHDAKEKVFLDKDWERLAKQYENLFFQAPAGYVIYDEEDLILEANHRFCELAGMAREQVIGSRITSILLSESLNFFQTHKKRLLDGHPVSRAEIKVHTEAGSQDVGVISRMIFPDADQFPAGRKVIGSIIEDISSVKRQEAEILKISYRDTLTGLYNRRYYDEILQVVDRPGCYPLSVAVMDLDGLKTINDTLGHRYGDLSIKMVGRILEDEMDLKWTVCRIGGDEFVVLAPKTEYAVLCEKIQEAQKKITRTEVGGIYLSVSCGTTVKQQEKESLRALIALAEDSMYTQKITQSIRQKQNIVDTILVHLFQENPKLEEHSRKVGAWMEQFADYLGMSSGQCRLLRDLGFYHDIGLGGIGRDKICLDFDLFAEEDIEYMRHPQVGNRIMRSIFGYEELAEMILYHHEYFNGKGYPYGRKGTDIPYLARLLAVVDGYDVIGRDEKAEQAAEEFLDKNKGVRYDPEIVECFLEFIKKHRGMQNQNQKGN